MRVWRYIYITWAVLCILSGYRMTLPDRSTYFDLEWSYITTVFLFFPVAPLAIVALRQLFGFADAYRRPSLDRSPFRLRDPLQVFRLYWVSGASMSLGSAFALPKANHNGLMMFWGTAAASVGPFVGERLIYLAYAKRITPEQTI